MKAGELPREIGLDVRILVALALQVLLVAALVWAVAAEPTVLVLLAPLAVLVLLGVRAVARRRRRPKLLPEGDERLSRALQRVGLVVDELAPACAVVRDRAPLSWTLRLPGGEPTVHVTTGLLDALGDRELEAVVAHELAHVLHRDASVMTLVAGPPAVVFAGLRETSGTATALAGWVLLGPPAFAQLLISRIVARHRVLVADRTAALLTGSPAAVAAALIAVERTLGELPWRELRRASGRDPFHFVPARAARRLARLWAPHPPTRERIERMERLEARLHR